MLNLCEHACAIKAANPDAAVTVTHQHVSVEAQSGQNAFDLFLDFCLATRNAGANK